MSQAAPSIDAPAGEVGSVPQGGISPPHRRDSRAPLLLRGAFAGFVTLLVALPLLALVIRGLSGGLRGFWEAVSAPAAVGALWLSIVTALIAAVVNGFTGLAIAWVLVRWDVPGRRVLSALVDLPFAIPTLVAGILLVALYGPQTIVGGFFVAHGFPIAFARPGIVLALLFVTLPFVVRAVEPVMLELDAAEEEAALTMGATRWTTFRKVILPPLLPAIASGTVQVFARSIAEFGSLAAVSGNIPYRTLTAPVYVLGEVERGQTDSAAAVSLLLLALAIALQLASQALARFGGARRA